MAELEGPQDTVIETVDILRDLVRDLQESNDRLSARVKHYESEINQAVSKIDNGKVEEAKSKLLDSLYEEV